MDLAQRVDADDVRIQLSQPSGNGVHTVLDPGAQFSDFGFLLREYPTPGPGF